VGIVRESLRTVDTPSQGDGGITETEVPEANSPDPVSALRVGTGAEPNEERQQRQPQQKQQSSQPQPQRERQQSQPGGSSSEELPHSVPVSTTPVKEQDYELPVPQQDASRNPASSLFERASLLDAEAIEALRSLPVPSAPEPASRPESPSHGSAKTMSDIILGRTSANAMSDIILGRRGSRELLRNTVDTERQPAAVAPPQAVQEVGQHADQGLGNNTRHAASSSSPRRSHNTLSEEAAPPVGAAAASTARGSRVSAVRRSSTPPPLPRKARQADCALCGRTESCPPDACFCEDCSRRMASIGSTTPATGGNRSVAEEPSLDSGALSSASDPSQSPGQSRRSHSRSSSLAWSDAAPDGGHGQEGRPSACVLCGSHFMTSVDAPNNLLCRRCLH